MLDRFFLKKDVKELIDEGKQEGQSFNKVLGPFSLTIMGLGAIIGTGLFVSTGQAASEFAGPGIFFSFLIGGMIAFLAALCYAEFAALIPIAGSSYSYAYATLGELPAWILACLMTMQYLVGACTAAVGWSGYFTDLMADAHISIPFILAGAPLSYSLETGWYCSGSFINLPAMGIVALVAFFLLKGVKVAAFINDIMVFLKISVVVLFIAFGFAFINLDNLLPLIPQNTGEFGRYGVSGIFRGAGVIFFAFVGFDVLATLAQDSKNPQKDVPRGMLGALGLCTIIYLVFSVVLTGIVNYKLLDVADPIALAIRVLGPRFLFLEYFIRIAILAGFTSVIMAWLMAQSRVFYTMAWDGLLPKQFTQMQEKTKIPSFATKMSILLCLVISGLLPIEILAQLVSIGTLLIFAVVCLGVLILRYKEPDLHRPFKTPFVPWIPIFGGLACFTQMMFFPLIIWIQLIAFLLVGCIIYFSYGCRHSKAQKKKNF